MTDSASSRTAAALSAAALLCLPQAAPAQADSSAIPAADRPVVAVNARPTVLPSHLRQIGETGQLTLHVREGHLLQLPRAATKVLVADPRVASFQVPSPTSVFVFAQAVGSTTLYALDANDQVIAAIRVIAEHNLGALREQISRSVPGADVELEPALNNRMIVRGKVRTPIEARQVVEQVQAYLDSASAAAGGQGGSAAAREGVINQLKVELSSQVNIQVRVVEVSRSLSHELGFNWSTVLNPKHGLFGADGSIQIGTGGSTLFDATASAGGVVVGGTFVPRNGRIGSLSGLLTAMQGEGMASVLAEPNLTAMSGESAAFAAGGEVPIVIITNNNVQIDYKSYGVILRMTPTLLSPNRISLHIAPEVSELSEEGSVTLTGGSTIPAFKVRRADTTVELASGQSFALAGMLRSTSAQQASGVPGLRSIPWFGRLFEHEATQREDTELVILVTANVVDPVAAGELQVPGQGLPVIDAQMPPQAAAGYLY
ncbi:type II and III secretion system protein family protein [Thauera linaloolentis]|uniref:Type II and III secretion system protein n=1 Tax=Thauera linaloolentis (strain DSM 12138 / JCM 21573 / CCUG 41526 / CIP 105981 / IAM 15112 / NBRC 102519 / 47Lol) TaxID=1123367 RepID=N6YZQ4_THAL4|nr:type II and III secretion system protein family protein [Thauera linaloolentis]ENO87638.1 type II and III secretion system protein [Thauera linaloolentis 47Lol = DSM 12138]MCM8565966.1 type II and III secretion system protein family protein [Thauera linaloolentis]